MPNPKGMDQMVGPIDVAIETSKSQIEGILNNITGPQTNKRPAMVGNIPAEQIIQAVLQQARESTNG